MAPPANMYQPGAVLTVGSHKAIVKKYFSEGGFAHVYQVEISPKENGTNVACLKRVAVPDKQSLNNLRAEVDSMKRLCGKRHIVSYIDSHAARMTDGSNGYEVFVLMELCENKGLIDFMNTRLQNRLTEVEILRIMGEVTEGVCDMHALTPALIHRDIKIENVLISGNGDYKLCDFGSASMVLRPPRNSEEFSILQNDVLKNTTPQYRSPEMLDLYRGLPIDEKSDVWALGVFLYKLCYYTTPFEAKGEFAILHAQFEFPTRPVYSDRLKNLISVLLREDPRRRPNAYQTLEEVCKMRDIPVPIEDYVKTKQAKLLAERAPRALPPHPQKLQQALQQGPQQAPQQVKSQYLPQKQFTQPISKVQIPIQNVPISKGKYGYNTSSSSVNDMNALNNGINYTPSQRSSKTEEFHKFATENPPVNNRAIKTNSNIQNLNQSMNNLSINQKSAKPKVPPKPIHHKYVDSVVQTEEDVKPKLPIRPARSRPQSMYVTSPTQDMITEDSTGSRLKRIISGLSINSMVSTSPKGENHIDSNIEFLKNLEQQDSGKSWVQQHTGGSLRSLRRISTGNKKVNNLVSSFTGKFSRPSSKNSSRASSIHESFGVNANHTGNSIKYRSSSSSIEEEELASVAKPLTRSSSIQRRVKQLMNRSNDPPIVKTAHGYGNDVYENTIDSDGFTKPKLYKKIQPSVVKRTVPSTPPSLSSQSTPSTVTKTPTQNILEPSPQSTLKKKAPPPKPKKPAHLRSSRQDSLDSSSSSQYLSVSNQDGLVKVQSLESEISDIDEWEKKFHEKYPNAV